MFYFIALLFFLVPFIVINITASWKYFLIVSIPILIFVLISYFDIHNNSESGSDFGFGRGLYYLLLFGFVSGFFTKAITLYLASKGVSLRKRLSVSIIGLLITPSILFVHSFYNKWEHRPPSEDCNYDIISFSINEKIFKLPSIRMVSADKGDGRRRLGYHENHISFYGNKSYRKFCEEFDNGNKPARVNMVSIDFHNIRIAIQDNRFPLLCSKSQLPQEVCEFKLSKDNIPENYPNKIVLYDKNKFDGNNYLIFGNVGYEDISKQILEATEESCIRDLKHDGYYYYYTGSEEGKNISFRCYKAPKKLKCVSGEFWDDSINVYLDFDISFQTPVEDYIKIRQKSLEFVENIVN